MGVYNCNRVYDIAVDAMLNPNIILGNERVEVLKNFVDEDVHFTDYSGEVSGLKNCKYKYFLTKEIPDFEKGKDEFFDFYFEAILWCLNHGCRTLVLPFPFATYELEPKKILSKYLEDIGRSEMAIYIYFIMGKEESERDRRINAFLLENFEKAKSDIARPGVVYCKNYNSYMRSCRERESLSFFVDEYNFHVDKGFSETLLDLIDKKNISDVECYKKSHIDRKTFSKIRCDRCYRPSKITVVSFIIGLHLNEEEAEMLLNTVGMSLSKSILFDVIIAYFVKTQDYIDIDDVNEVLYSYDQRTLG